MRKRAYMLKVWNEADDLQAYVVCTSVKSLASVRGPVLEVKDRLHPKVRRHMEDQLQWSNFDESEMRLRFYDTVSIDLDE
jgi:hypothetical protein